MATQLFFTNSFSDYTTGHNDTRLDGTSDEWLTRALSTSRGAGAISYATSTIDGPTNGVEVQNSSASVAWYSPPLDADVTIAGSITWNLRASENNMSANVAINAQLQVVDGATGSITLIDKTARTTELGTSEAAANFAETPAAGVACKRGDRLRVVVFGDDAGTMGAGFTFSFYFAGTSAGASGDSYLTLTENLTFVSEPAGTTIYPTDTTGPADATVSDTGFAVASTFENVDNAGSAAWSNVSNAAASDNSYATVSATGPATTDYLVCRAFGLSIPAGNVIRGIAVEVEHKSSLNGAGSVTAQLWNSGAIIGTNKSLTTGTTETLTALGGAEDKWGVTDLSEAMVEDAAFGVSVRANMNSGVTPTVSIDLVRIKVYYSLVNQNREAWTTRGAGVQTDAVDGVSGWTPPIQVTDTLNGPNVDWFTKQLAAFTLGGAVRVNARFAAATSTARCAIRCEIARVDSDGSNPTAWAGATAYPSSEGGYSTTEVDVSFLVSGDDLSVSAGQRLRIRFLIDDPGFVAMDNANFNFYYAGTSGGASGDTYLTFAQTLTEFVAGNPPYRSPYPQLLAH